MKVTPGFSDAERARVAALYWQAFGGKLGRVMGPDAKALGFIAGKLDPTHALCARDAKGGLLGVAGFKTAKGALLDFGLGELMRAYGLIGGLWRGLALSLLERDLDNERFLVDGIFVAPGARGRGVGSALLAALGRKALDCGYRTVRLDVIDGNDGAKRLYARHGFRPVDHMRTGMFSRLFRFEGATTMVWTLR